MLASLALELLAALLVDGELQQPFGWAAVVQRSLQPSAIRRVDDATLRVWDTKEGSARVLPSSSGAR